MNESERLSELQHAIEELGVITGKIGLEFHDIEDLVFAIAFERAAEVLHMGPTALLEYIHEYPEYRLQNLAELIKSCRPVVTH